MYTNLTRQKKKSRLIFKKITEASLQLSLQRSIKEQVHKWQWSPEHLLLIAVLISI
jgi:hypothetical protein